VTHDGHLVEIVHAGPAEMPVGCRKTSGLDDMGRHVKARAEPKDGPGVLGNVGLEKRYLHFVTVLRVSHEMSE
jgi:hypothetical protein